MILFFNSRGEVFDELGRWFGRVAEWRGKVELKPREVG